MKILTVNEKKQENSNQSAKIFYCPPGGQTGRLAAGGAGRLE
jgi:hypothetical protein